MPNFEQMYNKPKESTAELFLRNPIIFEQVIDDLLIISGSIPLVDEVLYHLFPKRPDLRNHTELINLIEKIIKQKTNSRKNTAPNENNIPLPNENKHPKINPQEENKKNIFNSKRYRKSAEIHELSLGVKNDD